MWQEFNRKNRDRRGGHRANPIINREGVVHVAPNMKAFLKRHEMKIIRREYPLSVQEGLTEMESDSYDHEELDMFGKDFYDRQYEQKDYGQFLAGYECPSDYDDDDRWDDQFEARLWEATHGDWDLSVEDHRHISGADYDDYRGEIFADPEHRRVEFRQRVEMSLGKLLQKYTKE